MKKTHRIGRKNAILKKSEKRGCMYKDIYKCKNKV